MAWADFAALSAGDGMLLSHYTDIRSALVERTGWVGESTENTAATNLSTTNPFNVTWLNSVRSIIDNMLIYFNNSGGFSSGSWPGWTKQALMGKIYSDLSGEASGIGYVGGVYNYINTPTRIGTLAVGSTMAADTFHPYLEHIMAIYYMLDYLRWIAFVYDNTGSTYIYSKQGTIDVDQQTAWGTMLVATAASYLNPTWTPRLGILRNVFTTPTRYRFTVYRSTYRMKYTRTPLAGCRPSGFDAGKYNYLISNWTYKDLGPWEFWLGCTQSIAGWSSGNKASSFNVAAIDTWEEFDMSDVSGLPTGADTTIVRVQHQEDDAAAYQAQQANNYVTTGLNLLGKPTTNYGT